MATCSPNPRTMIPAMGTTEILQTIDAEITRLEQGRALSRWCRFNVVRGAGGQRAEDE
jgi:hypothetical protein